MLPRKITETKPIYQVKFNKFSTISSKEHDHSGNFSSLFFFIQCFLKKILSFLTFLLSDQLIFDGLSHHHRSNSPLINLANHFSYIQNSNNNYDPIHEQKQFQVQFSDAKSTRDINKGRGARTTSIKTLSTLICLLRASIVEINLMNQNINPKEKMRN
jgi:hypothetical protein